MRGRSIPLVLSLFLSATSTASAQSDSAAVLTVVQRLFDGMRAADSAMIRSTFAPIIRFAEVNGWKITQLSDTRRRENCRDVLK